MSLLGFVLLFILLSIGASCGDKGCQNALRFRAEDAFFWFLAALPFLVIVLVLFH